jgi:hypothetical protein
VNGCPIEEGRELELQAAKKSIDYMRKVLNLGRRQSFGANVAAK